MRLACADYTFPLLPHDAALDLIAALGFEGVDIGLFENRSHLWPSTEFKQLKKSASALRDRLADRGLVAADTFLQVDSDITTFAINRPEADRREKARDWFLRSLEYANELGCHHLTALPGVPIDDEPKHRWYERACIELQWRVEESKKAKIVYGIEAHVGSIVPNPEEALALLRVVPGLTLSLDYTHFARAGIPDSRAAPLIPYCSHFQVRGACEGRLQCNFSQSTIDYAEALRGLKAHGYSGWVTIEYVRTDWERCNESDNLSETILYRDFVRQQAQALHL